MYSNHIEVKEIIGDFDTAQIYYHKFKPSPTRLFNKVKSKAVSPHPDSSRGCYLEIRPIYLNH